MCLFMILAVAVTLNAACISKTKIQCRRIRYHYRYPYLAAAQSLTTWDIQNKKYIVLFKIIIYC